MNKTKMEILKTYIEANVAPILVAGVKTSDIKGAVVIPANCPDAELTSHWVGAEERPPAWFVQLTNQAAKFLVIDGIDTIKPAAQVKFLEILTHRQVASAWKLPADCVIILTANKITPKTINEEVYAVVAHVEE